MLLLIKFGGMNIMKNEESKNKVKKPIYKKWWFWIIIVVVLFVIFGNEGSDDKSNTQQTESHIYDNAKVKDVMNGIYTEKIGEYSIIETDSQNVTIDTLTDWYFNYVSENDYNWCMILYTDKSDNTGVYASNGKVGIVQKDVVFEKNEHGDYMLADSSNCIIYGSTDDKTLEEIKFDE